MVRAVENLDAFRLLVRRCVFELYLDGLFVQAFNTSHFPHTLGRYPRRVGFLSRNGRTTVRGLKTNAVAR